MHVLYYMDLFVDLNKNIEERSFVAKCDLNADFLGRYSKNEKDLKVSYVALESIIKKINNDKTFSSNNVNLISIPDAEVKGILSLYNTSVEMIVSGTASHEVLQHISDYLSRKLKGIVPELVVYWEYCSDILFSLYPNATFLEGSHTGFWRLEQNSDILFNVTTKNEVYKDVFYDAVNNMTLTADDKSELYKLKKTFKDSVLFQTQINREYLDPQNKFKHLVFYAGNFPSLRFKKYSGYATNAAFLQHLLDILPDDCGIVYSKHSFDAVREDHFINNNPRIIDLAAISAVDADASMRVLPYVDAIINVYSNIFMPAMLVGTPVFSYGTSPNAKFALANVSDLPCWLNANKQVSQNYLDLAEKLLKYVVTHKVNTRFLRNARNSFLYLKKISENIKNNKGYINYLPEMGTIRGYTARFTQAILTKNPVSSSYAQTQFEILMGFLVNDKIKNIGFDIFDTLLYRPLLKPTDLFDLMEKDVFEVTKLRSFNFSKTRVAAEGLARYGKVETTLDEIYIELQNSTGFSDEIISKIKQIEISMESRFLYPRESLLEYFTLAKKFGKTVFVASDMYLSRNFLEQVLVEKGYDLSNVNVYVSAEERKVKHNGSLFSYILECDKLNPSQTLFVGDNYISDVQRPTDLGMIGFHYPKAFERFKSSILFDRNVLGSVLNDNFSFHIGLIANKIFDNPFHTFDNKSVVNNSSALLGYFVFGPLVLSLTEWLIKNLHASSIEKVLFSSRDSRVVIDIYDLLNRKIYNHSLPDSEYVYLSRTSTLPAYSDKARRMTLLSLYNSKHNVGNYIKYLFDIDINENSKTKSIAKRLALKSSDESSKNLSKISLFINEYYKAFESTETTKVKNVRDYFETKVDSKRIAMFDLGTRGTSRDVLSDLLGIDIPLYLFRSTRYKCDNDIQAYLVDTQNSYRHGVKAILPLFYELLLSDTLTSTCHGYEDDGESIIPVIESTEYTKSTLLTLSSQNFMRHFCNDFAEVFKEKVSYINSQTRDSFILPLSFLCSNTVDTQLLKQYYGEDPLWKDDRFSILYPPLSKAAQVTRRNTVVKTAVKNESQSQQTSMSDSHTRKTFIYFKRRFYKNSHTKKVWDSGRAAYLRIFTRH
ncbi:capsule biosynthesis protein CapA [Atlantibacter hermannii]|uniref:capsule biosynthesis protein CapA n=1 Tax=Atlantibacter hermannii TaxID=565 RepID=UPI0037BC189B